VCVDVAGRPPILISQCSDSKSATDYTSCISGEDVCHLDAVGVRDAAGTALPFAAQVPPVALFEWASRRRSSGLLTLDRGVGERNVPP
jgi:hypothetical protein